MTTFRPHPNNVSTCLAAAYTAGSGALVLEAGTGAKFGSVFPLTVTVIRASTYGTPDEFSTIYNATARNGDTLIISGAIEGTTDHDFVLDDRVEIRWTSGLAATIESAVNALETTVVTTSGSYADPDWLTALAGSKITGTIAPARLGTGTASSTNLLHGNGTWYPLLHGVIKTGSGTILATDTLCYIDSSAGAVILTLPSPNSCAGREFVFFRQDNSASVITIQRAGTDQINLATSVMVPTGWGKFVRLLALGGSQWLISGSN